MYIVLLRGINVAGQKKVEMAELVNQLNEFGLSNAKTYIQSGNIIIPEADSKELIKSQIEALFNKYYGFNVPTLVLSLEELKNILNTNPFEESIKDKVYFTLLHSTPDDDRIADLYELSFTNETVKCTSFCAYIYLGNGYGKSKLNNNFIESKLKVTATTRNYKTMHKLIDLAENMQ